uniref:Uncharacterized protein n=1 Tax=Salarias fasciatus TaxID=181472 RepID=A0A672JGG9_SALFA
MCNEHSFEEKCFVILISEIFTSAKLYLSIIDDVIDNMRELFFDEGLEDRVLDDLKHNMTGIKMFHHPCGMSL